MQATERKKHRVMSAAIEMVSRLPYQRLRYVDDDYERERIHGGRSRGWFSFRRVPMRRRFRLRVPILRKILRRKARIFSAVRGSYSKVLKRFKEGHSHFGDLFAGNYLFIQVNPTSFNTIEKRHQLRALRLV